MSLFLCNYKWTHKIFFIGISDGWTNGHSYLYIFWFVLVLVVLDLLVRLDHHDRLSGPLRLPSRPLSWDDLDRYTHLQGRPKCTVTLFGAGYRIFGGLSGFPFFYPVKFPDFPWFPKIFPWFFLSFHQENFSKKTLFSDISLWKYCLIKCNFLTAPGKKGFIVLKKKNFPQIKRFENGFEKVPWFEIFSLILAETPLFFPEWEKSSKFSLISLIGGNPSCRVTSLVWSQFFAQWPNW